MATTYTDTQMLEEVRAAIFGLVSKDHQSMTIAGDVFTLQDLDKLQRLEGYYQGKVDGSSGFAQVLYQPVRRR